ncbi:MAG: hypothetical protein MJE77_03500 [Proteobacteria bacterium]|nr:hypothetical protein [Pseudomonadota bacterium]
MSLVEALTLYPSDPMSAVLARSRIDGLDDVAIEDAANIAFHFNLMNRLADAFDFDLPGQGKVELLAQMLNRAKSIASKKRPSPSWKQAADGRVRPIEIALVHEALLGTVGASSLDLRCAVEAFTARLRGGVRPNLPVPEDLVPYLEKLSLHAYRITDEEVESLFALGYSKDAIFELTLAGAWGASIAALEHLYAELYTDQRVAA